MTDLRLLQIPRWQQFSWLRHGFSIRAGGVSTVYGGNTWNLGWTAEDAPASVRENRRLLVEAAKGNSLSASDLKLVTVRQVHSNHIHRISAKDALAGRLETSEGKAVLEGDGLISNQSGVLLAAGTADCVPVLIIDPRLRAVGAFHAGWRGTAARIVEHGVERMCQEYGSHPGEMLAAIGPSIGPCCYTVGGDVKEKFETEFPYGSGLFKAEENSNLTIDLWQANHRQLTDAGIRPENVTLLAECTACTVDPSGQPRYFSHRAQAGKTGRMLNVVGIVDELP